MQRQTAYDIGVKLNRIQANANTQQKKALNRGNKAHTHTHTQQRQPTEDRGRRRGESRQRRQKRKERTREIWNSRRWRERESTGMAPIAVGWYVGERSITREEWRTTHTQLDYVIREFAIGNECPSASPNKINVQLLWHEKNHVNLYDPSAPFYPFHGNSTVPQHPPHPAFPILWTPFINRIVLFDFFNSPKKLPHYSSCDKVEPLYWSKTKEISTGLTRTMSIRIKKWYLYSVLYCM